MMRSFCVVIALLLAAPQICLAQSAGDVAKAKAEIWAKEKVIYANRAKGDTQYYYDNTVPEYLAWVYGTPKPFRRDAMLAASGKAKTLPANENIENQFSDLSLHGDTAIIYYVNHRTVLPDGSKVDQMFDNIHVWVKDKGDWKLLASMSRLETPKP